MVHGYIDVYIWKAAVEKAQSFDPAKIRAAAVTLDAIPTTLGAVQFAANNSLVQTGYIGPADPKGQFKILWTSKGLNDPDHYDNLTLPTPAEHTSELQSPLHTQNVFITLKDN